MPYALWAWGYNVNSELGVGDAAVHYSPVQVPGSWLAVENGYWHSVGVKEDGTLWGWGKNNAYIASGDVASTLVLSSPTQNGVGTNWREVAAGVTSSHGIKADGTLWGWGGNSVYGVIGIDPVNTTIQFPTQVGTDSDWASIHSQAYHTLALKTNGTLWGWGKSDSGALGIGASPPSAVTVPMQIGTATWRAVAVGGESSNTSVLVSFSLGVQTDGSLWATGGNASYQLGLGDTTSRTSWTRVGVDSDWVAVAAGAGFGLAVKQDGSLWGWGRNSSYELGLGDTTTRTVPTRIGAASDWVSVAGSYASTAIKTNGAMWGWGAGMTAGLGSSANVTVPTQIGVETMWSHVAHGDGWAHALFNVIIPTFWTNLFGQREV